MNKTERTQELIVDLYAIVAELEEMYEGRKFTLDGHLIGSIGEVYAASEYNLNLLQASTPEHDARDEDGKLWQIKITGIDKIQIKHCPDNLLVLQLQRNGKIETVYHGEGKLAWDVCKGQKSIVKTLSVKQLRGLAS